MSCPYLSRTTAITLLAAVGLTTACARDDDRTPPSPLPPRSERIAAAKARPASSGVQAPPPDVGAAPADAMRTESGVAMRVLEPGTNDTRPHEGDQVTVHYTIWKSDGTQWFSTSTAGEPITFPLEAMIPGWREAMLSMTVGERRRVWIPEELAYGGREPRGTVTIDVQLIAVAPASAAANEPDDSH